MQPSDAIEHTKNSAIQNLSFISSPHKFLV